MWKVNLRKIFVFWNKKNTIEQNKEIIDSIQQEVKDFCKWVDILRDSSRITSTGTEIKKVNEPFLHLWNLTEKRFDICISILNKRKRKIEYFIFSQEVKY